MAAFFTSDLVVGCWTLKECALARVEDIVKTSDGLGARCLAIWGVIQVLMILLNAIRRLKDRAFLPLRKKDLTTAQWILYSTSIVGMMYKEGYEAFQLKWAPLVVKRAFMLSGPDQSLTVANILFTGPYAMGMFSATTNRMIVSWSVTIGIMVLAQAVQKMPYPYRNIVDAGVVAGLSYGCMALLWATIYAVLHGTLPQVDPCFVDHVDVLNPMAAVVTASGAEL